MHKILRLRVYGCHNLWKILRLSIGEIAGLQGMCFSNFFMNAFIIIIIIIIIIIKIISQFLISLNPPC